MSCYRYIELNPVRAGMVTNPADSRWLSYGANGFGQDDAAKSAPALTADSHGYFQTAFAVSQGGVIGHFG